MIFHIATRDAWDEAARAGEYRADTLAIEGFIHCSEAHQVAEVANVRFRGREDLVLLWIDPARVRAEIRYEDASDGSGKFPHIYGPINTDAVARAAITERQRMASQRQLRATESGLDKALPRRMPGSDVPHEVLK